MISANLAVIWEMSDKISPCGRDRGIQCDCGRRSCARWQPLGVIWGMPVKWKKRVVLITWGFVMYRADLSRESQKLRMPPAVFGEDRDWLRQAKRSELYTQLIADRWHSPRVIKRKEHAGSSVLQLSSPDQTEAAFWTSLNGDLLRCVASVGYDSACSTIHLHVGALSDRGLSLTGTLSFRISDDGPPVVAWQRIHEIAVPRIRSLLGAEDEIDTEVPPECVYCLLRNCQRAILMACLTPPPSGPRQVLMAMACILVAGPSCLIVNCLTECATWFRREHR